MAERVEKVTTVTDDTAGETRQVADPVVSGPNLVARIIWFVAGVILALLALRFVLALLGANPDNAFADFVYDASHPLVAPFFSLFSYDLDLQGTGSRFELYTLVAMAVYALVAWGLARLATINRANPA